MLTVAQVTMLDRSGGRRFARCHKMPLSMLQIAPFGACASSGFTIAGGSQAFDSGLLAISLKLGSSSFKGSG